MNQVNHSILQLFFQSYLLEIPELDFFCLTINDFFKTITDVLELVLINSLIPNIIISCCSIISFWKIKVTVFATAIMSYLLTCFTKQLNVYLNKYI